MSRGHTILTGAFLVLTGAVAHAAEPQMPQVPQVPQPMVACTLQNTLDATNKENVEIYVLADGQPGFECIIVGRKKIKEVVWTGDAKVDQLVIQFEPAQANAKKSPDAPDCWNARCALDKVKIKDDGEFKYRILVVTNDGKGVVVDPRMIIVP